MPKFRIILGLLIPVALAVAGYLWLQTPVDRPNILLITVDSLRADHLGAYGYPRATSPNIDALARKSVIFDDAFTQATLSAPSHTTMLTSVYPPLHGVVNNGDTLLPNHLNLPEVLRSSGYQTGMFVSHPFVSDEFGLGRGFDVSRNHTVHSHGPDHRHPDEAEEREPLDAVFRDALGWMKRERTRPFFVWLHIQHVHSSYEPPPPYDTMFGDPPAKSRFDLRCLSTMDRHQERKITLSRAEQDYVVALYDGEIAWVDAELGRMFEELRAAGLDETTIVALTSDHGEMLFDDPDRRIVGHGRHRADPVLRIPLIIRDPRSPGNERRVPRMVGLMDLAPTLVRLVGIRKPEAFHGTSLVPLLRGEDMTIRETFFSCTLHSDRTFRVAARTSRYKLVCDRSMSKQECRFYDLEADPAEQHDLVGDPGYTPRANLVMDELQNWFSRTVRPGQERIRQTRSERVKDLLRRAGYMVEEEAP